MCQLFGSLLRSFRFTGAWAAIALVPALVCAQETVKSLNQAGAKELVAVLDLDNVGCSKVEAGAVSERLREALLGSGRFVLVDRTQIDQIVKEQALQQTGCTSEECAVKVGRILGARKMVAGRLFKLSDSLWQVSAQLVDVESAQTLSTQNVAFQGGFIDLLEKATPALAEKLARSTEEHPPIGASSPPSIPMPQRLGRVLVHSDPTHAKLALDGKPVPQETDTLLENLSPGQHELTATKGIEIASKVFSVQPGSTTEISLKLQVRRVPLFVSSAPAGASVLLDGHEIGKTPIAAEVTAGLHKLEVQLETYQAVDRSLEVAPDAQDQRVNVKLVPSLVTIHVDSSPTGADVRLVAPGPDNTRTIHAGKTPFVTHLQAGLLTVQVSKDGYAPVSKEVLVAQPENTITAELGKEPLPTPSELAYQKSRRLWSAALGVAAAGTILAARAAQARNDPPLLDPSVIGLSFVAAWIAAIFPTRPPVAPTAEPSRIEVSLVSDSIRPMMLSMEIRW